MEHLNYFDYISFPNSTERDKIRTTYFDTHKLRISEVDLDKLSDNYSLSTLNEYNKYSKLNSKILNFNNIVVYLDFAILQMVNYFDLLSATQNEEEKSIYDALFRQACRNVSCEVYVYEEKIKDFMRFILKLDKQKTKYDFAFLKALKKACNKTSYGKEFLIVTETYHANENVSAITNLRNDEVHNSTDLLMNFAEENVAYNNELYQKIKLCLNAMLELRNGLYSFIVNHFGL